MVVKHVIIRNGTAQLQDVIKEDAEDGVAVKDGVVADVVEEALLVDDVVVVKTVLSQEGAAQEVVEHVGQDGVVVLDGTWSMRW